MRTYAELLETLTRHSNAPCQDFVQGDSVLSRSAGEVLESASRRGGQLLALGLRKGDRVGLMVDDPADFLPLIHGCLLTGLVAVPLYPPPLFGRSAAYAGAVAAILASARARALVLSSGLTSRVGQVPVDHVVAIDQLPEALLHLQTNLEPTDLAFLQFTSGSTTQPKGVRITHERLMANARAIMVDGLSATPDDHGVSWLPLYHDMGLIGFGLAPLLTNTKVTFLTTSSFIRNPAVWLRTIDATRATITFAPNFAYALTTRRVDPAGLELGSVRMWGCGAEPISPSTLEAFERRFSGCGVRLGQVSPCYGLAEATLAVTFTPPSAGRSVDEIDAGRYEAEGVAVPSTTGRTLRYVSCGVALADHEVSIIDARGRRLPERVVGEIVVRGPSVSDGYFEAPRASAETFHSDGLHTGDRGYVANGQLYVTGRLKDTVIVNGRNYDPHTIEAVAEQIDAVRFAAAVNVAGAEGDELAMIVECSARSQNVAEVVRARIASALGVEPARVVCVAPGALPRTTSGKLRRTAAKTLVPRHE